TGELYRLASGAGLEYAPERSRIPLMIGTWKPRMAALAGEAADEVKIGGCANPEMVRLMRKWIGNDNVGIVVGAVTVVDEDGDAAGADHVRRRRSALRPRAPTVALTPPPACAGTPPTIGSRDCRSSSMRLTHSPPSRSSLVAGD